MRAFANSTAIGPVERVLLRIMHTSISVYYILHIYLYFVLVIYVPTEFASRLLDVYFGNNLHPVLHIIVLYT